MFIFRLRVVADCVSVAGELIFRSVVIGTSRHSWMITQLENRFWGHTFSSFTIFI